ncbi:hypothetical protein [Rossellomorea marisflavi]|uniref:hypothetical protein n=1 Tax=Rossellomorea marisflavi TaxID=189381 RepID=UPI003F9F6F6F
MDIELTQNEEVLFRANITHNLTRMWSEAGVYESLYKSEGKQAHTVLNALESGLGRLKSDPTHFNQFNAENSWGLYKHAVPWLEELVINFKNFPDAIIEIGK